MIRNPMVRSLHTTRSLCSKKLVKKGKSHSSNQWLERQVSDPFVEFAKLKNYRYDFQLKKCFVLFLIANNCYTFLLSFSCRSAFKLLEIDERVNLLYPGQTVIDCGAAPGSWSEIAADKTNANGKMKNKPIGTVVGIDLLSIYPIEVKQLISTQFFTNLFGTLSNRIICFDLPQGAHLLPHMDFTKPKTQEKIRNLIGDKKINCVMSDMAPNATGVRSLDQENIMNLCYDVLRFAIQMSAKNASLLIKVWDNGEVKKFEGALLQYYDTCKYLKPNASRNDSAEKFLLARGFIGSEKEKQLDVTLDKK